MSRLSLIAKLVIILVIAAPAVLAVEVYLMPAIEQSCKLSKQGCKDGVPWWWFMVL